MKYQVREATKLIKGRLGEQPHNPQQISSAPLDPQLQSHASRWCQYNPSQHLAHTTQKIKKDMTISIKTMDMVHTELETMEWLL